MSNKISQRECTPSRLNPALNAGTKTKLRNATDVKLQERYRLTDSKGNLQIDAGSVWYLDLPTLDMKDRFGMSAYATNEMAHKSNRPYLVLTPRSHNEQSGIVCVVPLTTFQNRMKPNPLVEGLCVPISAKSSNGVVSTYDSDLLGFANMTDFTTCSVDRFSVYLHTITQEEMLACRRILEIIFDNANASAIKTLFPSFDTSDLLK